MKATGATAIWTTTSKSLASVGCANCVSCCSCVFSLFLCSREGCRWGGRQTCPSRAPPARTSCPPAPRRTTSTASSPLTWSCPASTSTRARRCPAWARTAWWDGRGSRALQEGGTCQWKLWFRFPHPLCVAGMRSCSTKQHASTWFPSPASWWCLMCRFLCKRLFKRCVRMVAFLCCW